MNNILIYTDLHINLDSLKECENILNEIVFLCDKYLVDTVISVGDNFDHLSPSSTELDLFATFIKKLNRRFIIVIADSHESTDANTSILNHYGIISENVTCVKEYIDDKYLYCGHFIAKESKQNYGGTVEKSSLKDYKMVVLGHGHSFEIIAPNICQLGASRYVDFAESNDKAKVVLLIENYKTDREKVHFLGLKSAVPMKDVYIDEKAQKVPDRSIVCTNMDLLKAVLDKIDKQTKVRVIFKDFKNYKDFLPYYQTYKDKFVVFKDRKDFIMKADIRTSSSNKISLKEALDKYLTANKIDEDIQKILREEIK